MGAVIAYCIVKIGNPPGKQASDSEEATCYAGSLRRDKDQMEVVAVDPAIGQSDASSLH